MGLFSVLGTSSTGLKSVQDALSLVSQNIAGANTDGYVRRVQSKTSSGSGVATPFVERAFDRFVQAGYWQAQSGSAYSEKLSDTLSDINSLFGTPGAQTGLPNLLAKFKNNLQTLVTDPSSAAARAQVIGQLNLVVNSIHSISDGIQSARVNAESALSNDVGELNSYLQQIDTINKKIGVTNRDPGLLDQRDSLVGKISTLIGVTVREQTDGTLQISTDTGFVLVDQSGAAKLSFDARGNIGAGDLYNVDPSKRKVGTIIATSPGGTTVDLLANGLVKSGELGALVHLRDKVLVETQGQIDDFAAALASVFSDQDIASTAITGGRSIDLAGLKSGNRIHVSYTDSNGKAHKVAFVAVQNASSLPLPDSAKLSDDEDVIGIDMSGGTSGMASAIQTALNGLGTGLTVTAGTGSIFNVTATAPASLQALTATVTTASIGANSKGLALFTDGADANSLFTDHFDGASQRVGFASRISLNPQIKADPSLLVTWGGTSNSTGDLDRANSLLSRFVSVEKSVSSNSQYGLTGGKATVSDILKQFIQQQSIATSSADAQASTQDVTLKYMEAKVSAVSGVNIDTELANMTSLQAAYAANARVMTTARDMLDVLMRM